MTIFRRDMHRRQKNDEANLAGAQGGNVGSKELVSAMALRQYAKKVIVTQRRKEASLENPCLKQIRNS
jgi:hypothetical protein